MPGNPPVVVEGEGVAVLNNWRLTLSGSERGRLVAQGAYEGAKLSEGRGEVVVRAAVDDDLRPEPQLVLDNVQ
eukprot:13522364-Alexandrium_andersonii.AAC.1